MSTALEQIKLLMSKLDKTSLPQGLHDKVVERLGQLEGLVESPTFLPEFDSISRYIEWITVLPWDKRTDDNLDINHAKEILDKNHYGLDEIKDRILEYLSVMRLKKERGEGKDFMRAPILCFVGLVGTGKTTIAASIAEAMGRSFARIPFGGMGNPLDLRGVTRLQSESEPGKVVKALATVNNKNPVILFDEIDRVTDEGRSSIMGVLVELLDPEQNSQFVDHYIDYPVDLSEVLFIAAANNTRNISTAVLDRLEPMSMPSYTDQEKITIGKQYMLPKLLRMAGLSEESLIIDENTWTKIVRPLGYDAGMRTLERTINGVVRKVARSIIESKMTNLHLSLENIKEYLPK